MRPLHNILLLAAATLSMQGCGSGAKQNDMIPVPRMQGYPRINLPSGEYRDIEFQSIRLKINDAVDSIDIDDRGFITAVYPNGFGQLFLTITFAGDTAALDRAIENRIERMAINTGGSGSELTQFTTPGGFDARLVVTPAECPTPVQLLVTDHNRRLVSAAVLMEKAATAPVDSLRPVIDMMARDMVELANGL